MVTTGPMFHVGWFSACCGVTDSICSRVQPRNGPPEAVTMSLETSACVPARRLCQMAECSESTGLIWCSRVCASNRRWPPATTDSLLARASWESACNAAIDGSSPMDPVMPLSTTEAPAPASATTSSCPLRIWVAWAPLASNACRSGSSACGFDTTTSGTWNEAACSASSSTCEPPAARPATSNRSLWRLITSSAWVPIEPVDPRMMTR